MNLRRFSSVIIILNIVACNNGICQWITGNVDTLTHDNSKEYAFSPNSIAIDQQNTLHVVWQKKDRPSDPNSHRIYYAKKFENGNWTDPVAVSDTLIPAVYPSVVFSNKLKKGFYFVYKSIYLLQNSNCNFGR
ncbi:MAG: hypothetical protein IPL53_13420 [Ignavibacteria bacterium]|nr:hypothetical protein [Ignavibacteria bacterium]